MELDLSGLLTDVAPTEPASAVVDDLDLDRQFDIAVAKTAGALYFDIETIPDLDREHLFNLDPLPDPPAPPVARERTPSDKLPDYAEITAKKVADIKSWISANNPCDEWLDRLAKADSRKGTQDAIRMCREQDSSGPDKYEVELAKHAEVVAERNKKLSVTPEYLRIVSIGWAIGRSDPIGWIARTVGEERKMLSLFWQLFSNNRGPLVGFNVLGFDIPAMFMRSMLLGVAPPERPIDLRPWGKDVLDLMDARWKKGYGAMRQKDLCRVLGLEDAADQEDDGSQVFQQFQSGDFAGIHFHVTRDIRRLQALHGMMQGFFC